MNVIETFVRSYSETQRSPRHQGRSWTRTERTWHVPEADDGHTSSSMARDWVMTTCPLCGTDNFTPPYPANPPAGSKGQLTVGCTMTGCGATYEVLPDGGTRLVDGGHTVLSTGREAVRAFDTTYRGARPGPLSRTPASAFVETYRGIAEATLAAPSAAVRHFREAYDQRPVPGATLPPERRRLWCRR